MEFITGAILSGIIYDMLRCGVSLTADNIKEKLKRWIVDDSVAEKMENELQILQLSDAMSESAIAKKIAASNDLTALLEIIKPNTTIIQTHSGTGDNVAGNKITNQ